MSIATQASEITLPANNAGWPTVLAFLIAKFPGVSAAVWQQRIQQGKVHWYQGECINEHSAFLPSRRLCYYREVETEPLIPFAHRIIYQDAHLLVADKPHFLPVTPGGSFVNECLLQRLKTDTGNQDLVPLHRLDRDTAGLVLFSLQADSRALYSQLFSAGQISKTYYAVAEVAQFHDALPQQWQLHNRIEKSQPRFLNKICAGEPNASSTIRLLKVEAGLGVFQLQAHTGKTHQLRLHMQSLGWPILHDAYYPVLKAKNNGDFSQPLQLLAAEVSFIDPISAELRRFYSQQKLAFGPALAAD
ncbi:pseudouridine synthase [Alishewanella sp. HL-SH05]|uniref:pseudouridine synthase n=1 Tax=Alishewanella sp. HL-SH05 TaxID=3461145 RepID=UPI0040437160